MPGSFRARLTLSYAVLTALLLTLVTAGLIAVVLELAIRPSVAALDELTAGTQRIVRDHWAESDDRIAELALAQPQRGGAHLMYRGHAGPPPGPPPRGISPQISGLFGLRPHIVPLHQSELFIGPDNTRIDELILRGLGALGIALIVAIAASWAIGRWITHQAIAPLMTVTAELRRFASGDFTPSVLESRDAGELGELTHAFNGAAAQVDAAFKERERSERRLRLFLGEAGHEMRTPLTAISAYLEVLDAGAAEDPHVRTSAIWTMRGETKRLRALVERVMALARLEGSDRGETELVDVVESVRDAIDHVTLVGGGDVFLTATGEDAIVCADPWELQEAVGNLVDNALKYGAGTPVEVSVDRADTSVIVRVSDGGAGVAEVDRERIFTHFFRGDGATGTSGSGLGLAIVARAAARLGGAVELEHAGPPQRTTFRLTLPAFGDRQTD